MIVCAYEKETKGSVVTHRVHVGDSILIETKNAVESTLFLIKDHLGSPVSIIDSLGAIKERLSYDPWGKRRAVTGATINLLTVQTLYTDRGYTGHLHADGVGLIHMNGRMYDPILARFISADPLIQSPNNLQSLNRYSYVMNNPLSYTDPTGYLSNTFKMWRRLVYAGIAAIACGPAALYCAAAAYSARQARDHGATKGAVGAATMAYVSAVFFTGAGGVGDPYLRVLAHGMIGGTMSAVAGGSFKSGFIASGLTAGFQAAGITDGIASFFGGGLPGNAIAGALIGGVGSELAGGSFRRGAEIGAMSQLFNACEHGECGDSASNSLASEAVGLIPGVAALQCALSSCSTGAWIMAVADFTPFGAVAKIAKFGNRAHKALSVEGKMLNGGGKSRSKPPEPLLEAEGRPHSIAERSGPDGQYTTHNGDGTWKQYRGSGQDHGGIPRPNVKEAGRNLTPDGREFIDKGRVRPPRPDEIPRGH